MDKSSNLLPASLLQSSILQQGPRRPSGAAAPVATLIKVPEPVVTQVFAPEHIKKEAVERMPQRTLRFKDDLTNNTDDLLPSSSPTPIHPTPGYDPLRRRHDLPQRPNPTENSPTTPTSPGIPRSSMPSASGYSDSHGPRDPRTGHRADHHPTDDRQYLQRRPSNELMPRDSKEPRRQSSYRETHEPAPRPDPFLKEQTRHGRQSYDRAEPSYAENSRDRHLSHSYGHGRPYEHSGSSKRRIESTSPEPRKKSHRRQDYMPQSYMNSSNMNALPVASPQSRTHSSHSSSDEGVHMDPRRQHFGDMKHQGRSRSHSRHRHRSQYGSDSAMEVSSPGEKSKSRRHRSRSVKSRRGKAPVREFSESESSSASSESDSESESEDENRQMAGASKLKMHGIIHDLMIELEKTRTKHSRYCEKVKTTSKRVQSIGRKLERLFRNLSDMSETPIVEQPPHSGRPALHSRPSHDKSIVSNGKFAPGNAMNNNNGSNVIVKSFPPVVRATSPGASGSKRSNTQPVRSARKGSISVATESVVETMTDFRTDLRNKVFGRKPRSLVLHSAIAGPNMEEIMVTSSLDGNIQFWDLEGRNRIHTIPKSQTNQPWAEDMAWVGKDILGVASAYKEGVEVNHQMSLIHVETSTASRKSSVGSGVSPTVSVRLQQIQDKPHAVKGGITCMSALTEGVSGLSLATAGMDKQVMQWKFMPKNVDGECVPLEQRLLHSRHTSTIQALCYSPSSKVLYSGGSDCKVIGWDMDRSEIVQEYKSVDQGRVNHIVQNPLNPSLILICHAHTSRQLTLHDTRQRFETTVLSMGFNCSDNLSKLVMPSWHPGGAIISCGSQSDSKINLWDIRWRDVHRGAGQSIDVQEKRVYKAAFHPRKPFLVSMSADSSLAFIDFRLNPGTVVHQ